MSLSDIGGAGAPGNDGTRACILVVEDDASISDVVCSLLKQEGYAVLPAYSGTEARLLVETGTPFDLAVCDLMLPGMPGEDVVALIRARRGSPVIVTSAKGAVADRVALLRMGADDYLVKPFDLDELLARIEALLRRVRPEGAFPAGEADADGEAADGGTSAPGGGETRLRYGTWEVDEEARTFTAGGTPVRLTRIEFAIVCTLMRHPHKVFTKRELFEAAWNEAPAVEEKTVNTHVSNIRAKLKGTGTEGYVQTVWGIGFKLAGLAK